MSQWITSMSWNSRSWSVYYCSEHAVATECCINFACMTSCFLLIVWSDVLLVCAHSMSMTILICTYFACSSKGQISTVLYFEFLLTYCAEFHYWLWVTVEQHLLAMWFVRRCRWRPVCSSEDCDDISVEISKRKASQKYPQEINAAHVHAFWCSDRCLFDYFAH